MHDFPDPKRRIRTLLANALADCTYVDSRAEQDGSMLLLQARRSDGRPVSVRFRGVRESEATTAPQEGSQLRVQKVGSGNKFSLFSKLLPLLKPPGPSYARVTIAAGDARLTIVCQDAEWWED